MDRFNAGGHRRWMALTVGGLALIFALTLAIGSQLSIGTAHAAANVCADKTGGTINGNIVVPIGSGNCILDGVTVNGDIRVGHSAVVLIIKGGSIINGSIRSPSGSIRSPSGTVRIEDSTVNGNIQVKDCGGAIKLERSEVNGHVKLEGNGSVVVEDNAINGSLTLKDNGLVTEGGNTVSGKGAGHILRRARGPGLASQCVQRAFGARDG